MKTRLFFVLLFILTMITISHGLAGIRLKQILAAHTTHQITVSNGKKHKQVYRDAKSYILDTLGIGGIDSIFLENDTIKLQYGIGNVALSTYLDNTDDQQLSLSNDTLYLEDGGFVVLAGLGGGENQTLSFSNHFDPIPGQ